MGWAGKTNGTLLALAQVDFDDFLTVDRNLSFQQDVNKFGIAVRSPRVIAVTPFRPKRSCVGFGMWREPPSR
jgi:hypothetical protein